MKIWLVGNLDDSDENMLSYVGVVELYPPLVFPHMGHLECAVVHHSHVIYPLACAGSSNGVVMSATNSSQLILPEVLTAPNPSSLFFTFFFSSSSTTNASCMTRRDFRRTLSCHTHFETVFQ